MHVELCVEFYEFTFLLGGGIMSRLELLNEIERLRAEMNGLANAGIEYEMLLEVSRKLDVLIVKWYKGKYLN